MADAAGRTLTSQEILDLIAQAKAATSNPAITFMQIFRNLPDNVTILGDTLRLSLTQAAVNVPAPVAPILNALQSIAKTSNRVAVTNNQQAETSFNGNRVRLDQEVNFDVGGVDGSPALQNITGVAAHKIVFWVDVESLAVRHDQGRLILAVTTKAATFSIDLGEDHP
jgi:hypothetical protein